MDNQAKHLNHPFYQRVREYRTGVEVGQILKGAEKYPEPFTTSSWTNDELVEHAMQENVDQAVYIYGMKERMNEQEKEINLLRKNNDYMSMQLEQLCEFLVVNYRNEIKSGIPENGEGAVDTAIRLMTRLKVMETGQKGAFINASI